MIHFEFHEKLAIVGLCAGTIVFFAIIMACKLMPFCWLYKHCPLRFRYDDDDNEKEIKNIPDSGKKLANNKIAFRYQLVNCDSLLPHKPSLTVSSMDKLPENVGAMLPSYTITPNAGSVPCTVQHVRSQKNSTSSSSSAPPSSGAVSSDSSSSPLQIFAGRRALRSSSDVGDSGEQSAIVAAGPTMTARVEFREEDEKLVVFVGQVSNVPPNVYGQPDDVYVQLLVVGDGRRWMRSSETPLDELLRLLHAEHRPDNGGGPELKEFRTQLVRRSLNPKFDQQFLIDVQRKSKRQTAVRFVVYTVDRYSHHSILAEHQVRLSELRQPALIDVPLRPFAPNLGEIMISLCYMPTAEWLAVNVLKVTNLKPSNGGVASVTFIKASIIRSGKVIKSQTTTVQCTSSNPIFNEALVFHHIPAEKMDKITLLITVLQQESDVDGPDGTRRTSSTDSGGKRSSSANGRSLSRRRSSSCALEAYSPENTLQKSCSINNIRSKPTVALGKLAFGCLASARPSARQHWMEMMKHPRRHVTNWHKLLA